MTVNLRAVDIRTGRLLSSVTTTKSILSKEITAGVFKFIDAQELLESELGYTSNEPVSLCVASAIESAVVHMIADGIWKGAWNLADQPSGLRSPVLQKYWLEAHSEARVRAKINQS